MGATLPTPEEIQVSLDAWFHIECAENRHGDCNGDDTCPCPCHATRDLAGPAGATDRN